MTSITPDWGSILSFGNLILSSAIVIVAFAELVYMLSHNLRSEVARGFCALLACVMVVYGGDIVIPRVASAEAINVWLRFQWLGISFVPAAYLHFSDALLRTTNARSRRRRLMVFVSYAASAGLFGLAVFTDLIVVDAEFSPPVSHLNAGPWFALFVLYYGLTALYGGWTLYRAWRRCLTVASRRRMAYLGISFAAPGLGVFPYLVVSGTGGLLSPALVLLLTLAGNLAVAGMLVIMSYSVAYYGVLTPDRVIKHSFVHYLLRGPFVAICVIVVMLVIPRVEQILGLPRDTVLIFAVVAEIVLLQLLINLGKPWIDRAIYRQDREEITWIQELDKRLLTSSDLAQFLHNLLVALCDLLRVPQGFIAVPSDHGLRMEATCGLGDGRETSPDSESLLDMLASVSTTGSSEVTAEDFSEVDGFRVWTLRSGVDGRPLGLLGVAVGPSADQVPADEARIAGALLRQAQVALEDRHLQQGVFYALHKIIPEIERIQQLQSRMRFAEPPEVGVLLLNGAPASQSDVRQWVRDALRHYWGGPDLARSPLLGLRVVARALQDYDNNPIRALRAVLRSAMDHLRPDEGEQRMTAPEWALYNILDLRFVQRRQVREIAHSLAMSESDLYRKQRLAIDEVARVLAAMELSEVVEAKASGERVGATP